jgi:hypothetical protein
LTASRHFHDWAGGADFGFLELGLPEACCCYRVISAAPLMSISTTGNGLYSGNLSASSEICAMSRPAE